MRPRGSASALEARRRLAVRLLDAGTSQADLARHLEVSRISLFRWQRAVREQGPGGLTARPHPPPPSKLSAAQRRALPRLLLKGPLAFGSATDLWTTTPVAEVLARRWGVSSHPNHIGRLLATLGWRAQNPTRRAPERDERQIRQWLRTQWPRRKKSPPASRDAGLAR